VTCDAVITLLHRAFRALVPDAVSNDRRRGSALVIDLPEPRKIVRHGAQRDTGEALSAPAEVLLCGPSPLSRGERELIATHVSTLNTCEFCSGSHAAIAALPLDEEARWPAGTSTPLR
jgi:alkylhydroperoxidase family enzyme